jgi:hypothetical protein
MVIIVTEKRENGSEFNDYITAIQINLYTSTPSPTRVYKP